MFWSPEMLHFGLLRTVRVISIFALSRLGAEGCPGIVGGLSVRARNSSAQEGNIDTGRYWKDPGKITYVSRELGTWQNTFLTDLDEKGL